MDFSIKASDWNKAAGSAAIGAKTDCIVAGVFESETLSGAPLYLDTVTKGLISRLQKSGDIDGKAGSTLVLHEAAGADGVRLLIVGLGKREAFQPKTFIDAARAAWRALSATRASQVLWTLAQEAVPGRDATWAVRSSIALAREQAYKFDRFKTRNGAAKGAVSKAAAKEDKAAGKAAVKALAKAAVKGSAKSVAKGALKGAAKDAAHSAAPERRVEQVVISVAPADEKAAKLGLVQGRALAGGVELARDLGNLPANVCTPTYLAEAARQLAKEWKLKADVLGQKQIEALQMGSFLSVAKGSVEPPQFIVLHYNGGAAGDAPVVLVGKGITFDTGGISLKPGDSMDEMKYDMCGAASVLGTLRAVAEIGLKLNVVGVIPTCENMPAGNALKPGDIVTSMSGRTIEVLNTDAEGRLILCDALTYVERFKPAAVVDIATLTGACIIALGHHNSGLYSKDDALADELLAAAKKAPDPAWRMPLDDEYQEQIKSPFADLANIGGRPAGSVTAACFLSHFAGAYPWAHLDIAGTAWKSGALKGSTGRPVPLLTQFLIDRAERAAGAPAAA